MPDSSALVDSGSVLVTLLLCGLMGVLGQGIRAAVGLKSNLVLSQSGASQQTAFNAAYFFLSLMIGFIAGVLAGLAIGITNLFKFNPGDLKVLLGIAAAGYAGADFIENTMSIVIPDANRASPTTGTTPPTTLLDSTALRILSDHTEAIKSIASSANLTGALFPSPAPPPNFGPALKSVAPSVKSEVWVPALTAAFSQFDITNIKRIAAAIGQFLVEAGDGFTEIRENLSYTHAERLVKIFPREFSSEQDAIPYLNNPEKLGNKVYAKKLGNGNEASGDGFRFRGRGLIQLTGRSEYSEFGATVGMSAEQAAEYCETPTGAAVSGGWYLSSRGCLPYADSWNLAKITLLVNGKAMTDHAKRVAFSNAMLKTLGG